MGQLPHLQEVVADAQRYDDDQEDRRGVGDGNDSGNHTDNTPEESNKGHAYGRVGHVHVLTEAIQDAADRCRVEEGHRGTHDALEEGFMEDTGTDGASNRHGDGLTSYT